MRRFPLVLAAAAGAAALAWLALRPPELPPIAEPGAAPAALAERPTAASGAQDAKPVRAIDAHNALARVALPEPPKTLYNEFLAARQYRALYDRVRGSAMAGTAEGKLVLYEILRECAEVTGGRRPGWRSRVPGREEFIAGIADTDPQREQRIAAYEAFTTGRCEGFAGVTIALADLTKLLREAADAGDPRARAIALEQDLWQARRAGGGGWRGNGGVTLTDEHVGMLRELAGTGDPEALRVTGRILANSWHDFGLRIGPDQQPVEQRPFMNAFLVLACELGAPCGADTPRLQQACAMRGHCNAQNFPDYLYYYGSTPHDSALLMEYRAYLRRAIETGDWSQLTVVRGVGSPPNRITFVPGPR